MTDTELAINVIDHARQHLANSGPSDESFYDAMDLLFRVLMMVERGRRQS